MKKSPTSLNCHHPNPNLHHSREILIVCENIPRKIIFLIMKSSYRPTVGTLFSTKSFTNEFSESESIEINFAPLVSQIE